MSEPNTIRNLLDALLEARERRDREERFTERWHAVDRQMHAVERAIFQLPPDGTVAGRQGHDRSLERAG